MRFAGATCAVLVLVMTMGLYASVLAEPLPKDAVIDRIVAYKGKHLMEVYDGETLLKTYSIAVGKGGQGPKRYFNDNKTPEGEYRIDSRHKSRKFHLFLHVSYPNRADRRAYKRGKRDGTIPSGRSIGGAIGIHGEKKGKEWLPHKLVDWTQGCIAVDNDEIEELYRAVKKNAKLIINP